jgi:hypothetical protein
MNVIMIVYFKEVYKDDRYTETCIHRQMITNTSTKCVWEVSHTN